MNFTTLLEMINASEAREDDPEFQSPVDLMFERLEERDPDHFAVRQYKKFLLSAGKTRSSILISAGARLAPFDIREVRELMEDDELELDTIGDEKTALFLIMSDTDTTFNFILAMVQSQLINLLCDRADDKYGGRLPVHVRMILDEFANIGQIPNFDKLIATIRSREISASIILQSQSQLKAIYKDAAEIISDNCDCTLFLSGRGKNAKEIADVLGKETIDSYNQSENRGAQTSHGLNYQKLGKELMSQDEIATMDGGKCILQVRGVRPFFSEKYDITRTPGINTFPTPTRRTPLTWTDTCRPCAGRGSGWYQRRKPLISTTSTCRMKIWLPWTSDRRPERSLTVMEHSDELTFADYFKAEKEIYRAIISAAVMCRWIAEHDTPPTKQEAEQMELEINRQMCEAWAEMYSLAVLNWLDDQLISGPSADCDARYLTGDFSIKTTSQSEIMEVNLWNFSIARLLLCRPSLWASAVRCVFGAASICWRGTGRITRLPKAKASSSLSRAAVLP